MGPSLWSIVGVGFTLFIAELLASLLSWHGQPQTQLGNPVSGITNWPVFTAGGLWQFCVSLWRHR